MGIDGKEVKSDGDGSLAKTIERLDIILLFITQRPKWQGMIYVKLGLGTKEEMKERDGESEEMDVLRTWRKPMNVGVVKFEMRQRR